MSAYRYGATGITELLAENRGLRERLAKAEQTVNGLRSRQKPRRPDDYPAMTPEELERELAKARQLFPEPVEVKQARLTLLDRELATASPRPTLTIAA